MKAVEYTDENGKNKVSIVRTADADKPELGIMIEPPPLDEILEQAKVKLHNELVKRKFFTFLDIEKRPGEFEAVIKMVITNPIVTCFRAKELNINKE